MEDFFKVDEEAFQECFFKVDTSKMNMDSSIFSDMDFSDVDLSDLVDGDAFGRCYAIFSEKDFQDILKGVSVNLTQNSLAELFNTLLDVIRNLWVITRKQILGTDGWSEAVSDI